MDACRDETVHPLHRCLRRVNQDLQQFLLILRVHGEHVDEGQNLRYGRDVAMAFLCPIGPVAARVSPAGFA